MTIDLTFEVFARRGSHIVTHTTCCTKKEKLKTSIGCYEVMSLPWDLEDHFSEKASWLSCNQHRPWGH